MTTTETAAVAALAREISEALGRFADTIEGTPTAERTLDLMPSELTKTEAYFLRQRLVLQQFVDAGGSMSLSDFRVVSRNAGYKRTAQQYWRKDGLCKRDGETISITPKGKARLKYATNYTKHIKAA